MSRALYHNNSQLFMFKPSLKRPIHSGKQFDNDSKPYNTLTETTRRSTIDYRTKIQEICKPGSNMIVPPILFTQIRNDKANIVFNPLNYEWCTYPETAYQMINNDRRGEMISKDAGVYKDLFWCYNGQEIMLWRQTPKQQKRFKLPLKAQIIALGQLQNCSLHFKSQKKIILVAGIQNYIHLFGIDKDKMNCTDFKMCHQIENSSYVQKITFVDNNKILFCSDTGQHAMFDFTAEFKIYKPQGSIIKKLVPFFPLLYPQKQRFCQQLLSSGNFIVSLMRGQKKRNWLYFKASQLITSLLDNNFNEEWIEEQTKVEIYKINHAKYEIVLVKIFTEDDILFIKRSKTISRNGQEKERENEGRIVSINLSDRSSVLEIVTHGGTFIKIHLEEGFRVCGVPITIPSHNSLGPAGFFVMKNNTYRDAKEGEAPCLASLGTGNLTLTSDAVWYISQSSIEIVKTNGIVGTVKQSTFNLISGEQWYLLTKKGYFIIRRMKPQDIIVGMLAVKQKAQQQSGQKRWMEQTNYQLYLDSLNNAVGEDVVIQSLIQLILMKKNEKRINYSLINFIKKFLDTNNLENWRDWHYELSQRKDPNRQKEETIQITNKLKDDIWALIFKMQGKAVKILMGDQKQRYVSAYWLALKNIFYKKTQEFFWVNPSTIKLNKWKIDQIVKFFERLVEFFGIKRERQMYLQNKLYLMRQQQKLEKMQIQQKNHEGFELFKNINRFQPPKKLQESFQTQIEKFSEKICINESAKALEKDITEVVTKIKSVIEVFLCLTESKQCEKIASFYHIFRQKQSQIVLKQKLIQSITDHARLRELHAKLPQLQLQKDLNLIEWLAEIKGFERIDLFDLKKLASWLSSPYFGKVFILFESRRDLQIKLLLHFKNICSSGITFNTQILENEAKRQSIYSEDMKTMLNQTIKYYKSQQQKALVLIKDFITKSITNYINSLQDDYGQAETILNNVIEVVTLDNDQFVNQLLEEQLIKINVSEKLILFRRLRKVEKPPLTVNEILSKIQPKKKKEAPVERLFMNNFQRLMNDNNIG